MANIQRNFIAGRMNKSLDERLIPNGEYVDALNVRLGSTEETEIGAVENSKGNTQITTLQYTDGTALSSSARCIGAFEDGANETIYWFVHDPSFTVGATGKLDLVVSFNTNTGSLLYHVISIDNGTNVNTTLNFDPKFLITGVNKIGDLLFFTDNLNPPRVVNINSNYTNPVANIDQITSEELLVVKKPPAQSPPIELIQTGVEDAFMEDNFICFAYRYRYSNGEYSAVSQFSEPAFIPGAYEFSADSFLNEGMENDFNGAIITYNSGSSLVVGVDLLFKEANDPTIKIIERINKLNNNLADNTDYTFTFTNSKIFTVLPESEILRLYDNVPIKAKAQTLMGNRLIYGNYVEGYDLTDIFNSPLELTYTTELENNSIGETSLTTSFASFGYQAFGNSATITNNTLELSFANNTDKLKKGAEINIDLTFIFNSWFGTNTPDENQGSTSVSFSYILQQDFTQSATPVNDLFSSTDFQAKFGLTEASIQTVANAQAGTGVTLTDKFNAAIDGFLGSASPQYNLYQTGISNSTAVPPAKGEPILGSAPVGNNLIRLQIPAAQFLQDGGTNLIIQYFNLTSATATIQERANTESLHSNRGYEIGIIYMDDFNRSSTALVSPNNTVNIPCSASTTKNEIKVNIPISQRAPSWATRYKFCIKPDRDTYNTVYSSIFFEDPNSNNAFLLLEGENIKKVEDGDRLIVKRDSAGPMQSCVYATVLEKTTEDAAFITPAPTNPVPGGTYMKMNASDFSAVNDADDVVSIKVNPETAGQGDRYPVLAYPFFVTSGTNYTVPAGTRVVMRIEQTREGRGSKCERRTNFFEQSFVASDTYTDMYQWFIQSNIANSIENNSITNPSTGSDAVENVFINTVEAGQTGAPASGGNLTKAQLQAAGLMGSTATNPTKKNFYRFYQDSASNDYYLLVSGTRCCGGSSAADSTVRVSFTVYRRDSVIVFETEPQDSLPDVWYENDLSFSIDSVGNHSGNVTNQNINAGTPGVVNTGFFNCYAFGNGVESYKIRDSVTGKSFNLGNRVYTTSNVDYKAAHRFADLTYSGVFNDETNVNKLNEFNLGLANFKPLEETYGDI